MPLEPGQTLGHYLIERQIGQGGMGAVFLAQDTKLGRKVALKVLPAAMASDADRLARFQREARAVAALNHPNIVTLYSVEEDNGVHFITMELVEGQTLAELLPRNGFALSRLLEIAIPLADAVSRAHRAGITHRDLKPDNIMIDREGRLCVLDFGLAKLQGPPHSPGDTQAETAAAITEEGKILGTVAYMSPEQAEGKNVDPRSDIFSLGTLLYEMASGKRPFRGETSMSTIGSILRDQPTPVNELNRSLPRHAGRVIRRCLAKDPDRRYQTALDLRIELEHLKEEVESGELAVEIGGTIAPSPRRSRSLVLLGAVAVVAIAAVLVVSTWRRPDPPATIHTSRPITGTIEQEDDPSWSPDGKYIAFSRMSLGSFDVLVQPIDGGDAVVRAGGPGDEITPHWSPDQKYLAYLSTSEPGSSVFLVPSWGGKPRKLIETDIPALDLDTLRSSMGDRPWSDDGNTLLVSRVTRSGRLAVYRVDRASGQAEQMTFPPAGNDDLSATYSFDGRRIVFQREHQGRGTAMVLASSGGDPEVLLDDDFDNEHMAWRPDNRHLVLHSSRGGATKNLFELDSFTGITRQLTFETKIVMRSSVSSDDRVIYSPFWHDTFLFTLDAETGERTQITSHNQDNYGARFSPDGRTIAYHSTRTGNSEIWLHHLDGRPETQFTDYPAWDLYPEWSPDGQRLIFVSDRDGGSFKMFIANADGAGRGQLLVDQPISWQRGGFSPVNTSLVSRWSPDGELIGYLVAGDEGTALWTVEPDGEGARERMVDVTGFDWYRNSRQAVVTRRRGSEAELIAVDLGTGREQTLFVGALTEFDVAPDGNAVAFCFGRGHMAMGVAVLRLAAPSDPDGLPRALGEPAYLARPQGTWHVHNGGWSPDSKRLVYTQDTDYGDIYELVKTR